MRYSATLIFLAILLTASCTSVQQGAIQEKPITPISEVPAKKAASSSQVPQDIKALIEKSAKIKGIYYKYSGPETGSNFHEFYIKGSRIKYKPHLEIKTLDRQDSYDSIFIDKAAGTAASYCEAAHCTFGGMKANLDYSSAYIPTIFDWLEITMARKVGEEVIDDRSTWKVDSDKGILWIDTFYGIPLKAESDGNIYRFQQISVNSVQDSDVIPKR